MYTDDQDISFQEYQRRKRAFVKRRKLKRFFAVIVLLSMALLIVGSVFFIVKGIISLKKGNSFFSNSEYVDDPPSLQLVEVDNRFLSSENESSNEAADGTETDISDDLSQAKDASVKGTIIIDAGHGGQDSGTFNDLSYEKDINLSIAIMVRDKLVEKGYSVVMTREDDTYVGLSRRATFANEQDNPLAFVSVHQNSVEDYEAAAGVEALTYKRAGCGELAELLAFHTSEAVGAKNRGVSYKTNLVVTSKTTMPAVIIECGFMSNSTEAELLASADYQAKLSVGITNALVEFINNYY